MDIARKEGLVTVEMDQFAAALFEPERLNELMRQRPGYEFENNVPIRERYIVEVRRITTTVDGIGGAEWGARHTWVYEIEHAGEIWRIPEKVMERMMKYRESLIKEARSEASRAAYIARNGLPATDAA